MTSGAEGGTSGTAPRPAWLAAYAAIAVATVVIGTVNVLSVLDERSWMNRPIDWWQPAVWEGTSGLVLLALAWIPGRAIERFPLAGPKLPRNLAFHAVLTLPFSLVHVASMVVLREGAYAIAGEVYDFGGWEALVYEYRKDVISYALYAGVFWLTARLIGTSLRDAPRAPPPEPSLLIDEGQRLLRVVPAEVLAARSSGNYVEYLLADGRRPLMRTTLSSAEVELSPRGFVRTHRSWLVNTRHVSTIEAEGSGDYGLTLTDGTQVPLSRRYRQALEALRGG